MVKKKQKRPSLPKIIEVTCKFKEHKAFKLGQCSILIQNNSTIGWHMSISHPRRYPTWDEIKAARYELVPNDITMAMILPPPDEYINIHQCCFHLHEINK